MLFSGVMQVRADSPDASGAPRDERAGADSPNMKYVGLGALGGFRV